MPDHDKLLRLVLDNPDDVQPRLVLADWLMSHGAEERGELIVVECELEQVEPWSERWRKLRGRQSELIHTHKKKWSTLTGLAHSAYFRRGFIETISLAALRFVEVLPPILEREPVRVVRFLRFRDTITDEVLRSLADSPLIDRLAGVELNGSFILETGLQTLLENPGRLLGLRELDLSGQIHLTAEIQQIILSGGGTFRLAERDRGRLRALKRAAMESFARHPWRRLRALNLQRTELGDGAVEPVLEAPQLATLERLDLEYCKLGDATAAAIAKAAHLSNLKELSLGRNAITDEGVAVLASAPHLSNLRMLHLGGNNIGRAGFEALATSPYLRELRELALDRSSQRASSPAAGDAGVQALARSTCLTNLRYLSLEGAGVTDVGAAEIASSETLARLGFLSLKENRISADQQQALRARFGVGVCSFSRPR